MKINEDNHIEFQKVSIEGTHNVKMKILIGSEEGSKNIIMRYFSVAPKGHTPKHRHDFEHVVKIEKNKGIFRDKKGNEHTVTEGMSVFIEANEEHQFQNPFDKPFDFLCIIPNPEKNNCCMSEKK
jgi:quercetin dioxygenase-like cupin family protein